MKNKMIKFSLGLLVLAGVSLQASTSGKELFMQKCNMCHKTSKPTDMSKLIAPPIMGVMRHVKMNYANKQDAVNFIVDYVLNPQRSKAVCMAQNIDRFGLMPSQKGAVTKEQVAKIASYIYDNYPPKGFVGMHENQQGMMGSKGMMGRSMQKGAKKIKPFLIKKGLPHLTKILVKMWNDPKLNLTKEQKKRLVVVRKETLKGVKMYMPMVNMIQNKIVSATLNGANPKDLEKFVNKLATIKAKATMIHLQCIYNTKNILTPQQFQYVMKMAKNMKMGKKRGK